MLAREHVVSLTVSNPRGIVERGTKNKGLWVWVGCCALDHPLRVVRGAVYTQAFYANRSATEEVRP